MASVRHVALLTALQECRRDSSQNDPRWRIGEGGVTLDDVVIIGIVHVSSGSWQVLLQLRQPSPQTLSLGRVRMCSMHSKPLGNFRIATVADQHES